MMTLTAKNGLFFFYRHVFLNENQVAFIDTLKGRITKTKSFYRNLFTNAKPMIVDLSDKEFGIDLKMNDENYYFKINLSIDKNMENEIFRSASYQFITEKGMDIDFIKPKFREAIRTTFKKGLKDNEHEMIKEMVREINVIIKDAEDISFLTVDEIDVYKEFRS